MDLPIGLGWVINPGARITRRVVGAKDEDIPKPPVMMNEASISPTSDLIYLENMEYWNNRPPSSNYTDVYDGEYDIFTYYTGTGVSGRFIIQKQGSQFVARKLLVNKDIVTIHSVSSGGSTYFDYFDIIDENGVNYRFGNGLSTYNTGPVNEITYQQQPAGCLLILSQRLNTNTSRAVWFRAVCFEWLLAAGICPTLFYISVAQ